MSEEPEERDLLEALARGDTTAAAALVAEYAELLKGTYWARQGDLDQVLVRAQELGPAFAGDRRVVDFVSLVAVAADLKRETSEPRTAITDGE